MECMVHGMACAETPKGLSRVMLRDSRRRLDSTRRPTPSSHRNGVSSSAACSPPRRIRLGFALLVPVMQRLTATSVDQELHTRLRESLD
jgi:hypothetical protein